MTTVLESSDTTLRLQRIFAASLERVWDAITDPDQVPQWFGCNRSRGISADIDLKPGGKFQVVIESSDGRITMDGKVVEARAPHFLNYQFAWAGDDEFAQLPTTDVTIELKGVAQGTEMTLTHTGFPNAETCGNHHMGWDASLEKISAQVESTKPEIHDKLAEWDAALARKDTDALTKDYTDDFVYFDIGGQAIGSEVVRQIWNTCWEYFGEDIRLARKELKLTGNDTMMVLTGLSRMQGMKSTIDIGDAAHSWIRFTTCFQKIDGQWKIFHEHISYPVDCVAQKPTYILD
ncbi:MAG: SRPBCC domain-containing protein [Verrucomicrobiota bacterium]